MPDGTALNNHDNDAELDITYDEQPASESADIASLGDDLPYVLNSKEFRAKIESSKNV